MFQKVTKKTPKKKKKPLPNGLNAKVLNMQYGLVPSVNGQHLASRFAAKTKETCTRRPARPFAVVIELCAITLRSRSRLTTGYIMSAGSLWMSEISPSDLTSFFLKQLEHIPDTANPQSVHSSTCICLQPKSSEP